MLLLVVFVNVILQDDNSFKTCYSNIKMCLNCLLFYKPNNSVVFLLRCLLEISRQKIYYIQHPLSQRSSSSCRSSLFLEKQSLPCLGIFALFVPPSRNALCLDPIPSPICLSFVLGCILSRVFSDFI